LSFKFILPFQSELFFLGVIIYCGATKLGALQKIVHASLVVFVKVQGSKVCAKENGMVRCERFYYYLSVQISKARVCLRFLEASGLI